jgi:ketosteroid isomerase-like protein
MSREKVRLVERLYELWNEGASMAHLLDPEFEWVSPPDAVEPGTLQGVAAARAGVAKIREIFPEHRFEPEKYVETGDDVVVIIRARARTETGLETDWRGGHVWTVHQGKVARLRAFNDVQQAFEAVGLRE